MITLFLATVLGWYLVIFGVLMVTRHQQLLTAVTDMAAHRGQVLLSAIIAIVIGLLIVASHNVWVMGWAVLVTILGWLILLSGIARAWCPHMVDKAREAFFQHPGRLKVVGVVVFLIGLLLLSLVYSFYLHVR